MATGVHLWSQTAGTNASADTSINWAEGQAPSSINDSARALMARVADFYKDLGGLTTAGSSTAFTCTSNRAFASAAVMAGSIIVIIPHANSGAAPTLAVDGLTARQIRSATGTNIATGALIAGTPYAVLYVHASTEFILLGYTETFANVTATGTLAVTGAVTLSSTLAVTGNISVNTNKFNITAASGNTAIAGDLAIATNKFTVAAASGNTVIAGTLNVTGLTTATGGVTVGAGTTGQAPIQLVSGTNLTTPTAGAIEYDGAVHYSTHAANERGIVPSVQWIRLSSTYTLTSQTAAQKLFNSSTNGAVTVAGSATYEFECEFDLTAMSGSSGAFGFAIGGTATLTSIKWSHVAQKSAGLGGSSTSPNYGQAAAAADTAIMANTTTTTGCASIKGIICVNAGGTIIPQVSLTVAAAAVVGINSYFAIWPIGTNVQTTQGNWS